MGLCFVMEQVFCVDKKGWFNVYNFSYIKLYRHV